ncbi:HTH-type transcriptional regulator SutR [Ascidiaceihabitans donghaensis]|uniref:HTH-type transcriptional regulator SutR n=2 Tax=Ascidiaceihabitans donghaensis TaxID=1510460 RepID=A0A2R8B895_9RHOB|nr:HTH-type transcriptional regulator SutR [Ascidiaceihabitans donghaensis]
MFTVFCQPRPTVMTIDFAQVSRHLSSMTESNDTILTKLPARLKAARQAQGLSLDAVAKLSGVSRSMVSQIERSESSPTIATLWNLTRALQVDFAGLLDEGIINKDIEVLRADDVPNIRAGASGLNILILSPPEDAGKTEIYELRFTDAGVLDSQPHTSGTKEHLTVISGSLYVTSGEHTKHLQAGDTARYSADVAHRIEASGPASAFLIVSASGSANL